jgi:hypothetical protein
MITNKNSVRTLVAASSALVALDFSFSFTLPALAAPVLKGNVQEQNKINPDQNAPGLSRSDMNSGGDPFGNTQTEQALAPPSFDVENALPPAPPKKAFGLNANQDGNTDDFDPRMMSAVPDQLRQQQAPMPLETTTPGPQMQPQDPDMAPEMQLAWDAWHKQVAAAVYQRYTALSNAIRSARPQLATATYTVTRDGRIVNARLSQPSWNPIYNSLILGVINSISGDLSILAFPQGSHRMMVEKSGTFSQNYGNEGFRYTTGDRETVRQGR